MIRWDEPIEAVHEDGRVVPAKLDGRMSRQRGFWSGLGRALSYRLVKGIFG